VVPHTFMNWSMHHMSTLAKNDGIRQVQTQKMTAPSRIECDGMPNSLKPSKEEGRKLRELARRSGLETNKQIADALDMSEAAVERLVGGRGSHLMAAKMKRLLEQRNIPRDAIASASEDEDVECNEEDWARIGYLLRTHAPRTFWIKECARLRKIAAGLEEIDRAGRP
jgi:predicted transcriptional regulator